MGRLFITSVGISLIDNTFGRNSNKSIRTSSILQRMKAVELEKGKVSGQARLEDDFFQKLLNIPEKDIPNELRRGSNNRFSAEFSSLYVMDVNPQTDKIILLATDSGEGIFAARVNKRLICHRLMEAPLDVVTWQNDRKPDPCEALQEVQIIRVDKMRMDNPGDFERYGIHNLLKIIEDINKNYPDDEKLVNFTGGFKGIIPILTGIAWRYNWRSFYLYEYSHVKVVLKRPDWICVSQQHATDPAVEVEVVTHPGL